MCVCVFVYVRHNSNETKRCDVVTQAVERRYIIDTKNARRGRYFILYIFFYLNYLQCITPILKYVKVAAITFSTFR